jgi:hypothetical protein
MLPRRIEWIIWAAGLIGLATLALNIVNHPEVGQDNQCLADFIVCK